MNMIGDSQVDIYRKAVSWKKLASSPVRYGTHTAVLLGRDVFVGGGYVYEGGDIKDSYRLDVYNLTTNWWSPSPITTPYRWFAITVLDDKLVTAGGATKNDELEVVKKVLVLNAGQWKDYSEMPTARYGATAVGYHSMLIVVGGIGKVEGNWAILSTIELLDTTNGCWYTCNNLPSPHQQLKAAIMNNKLYLLGGTDKDLKDSTQVFVASLDTLSTHQLNWQSVPSAPFYDTSPVVLYYQFLLTVGGWQQGVSNYTSEVNIFNPSTGQWKNLINIPAARCGPAVVGVADNSIIVIGGITDDEISNTVWIGIFE